MLIITESGRCVYTGSLCCSVYFCTYLEIPIIESCFILSSEKALRKVLSEDEIDKSRKDRDIGQYYYKQEKASNILGHYFSNFLLFPQHFNDWKNWTVPWRIKKGLKIYKTKSSIFNDYKIPCVPHRCPQFTPPEM